ncbi:PREDICTED: myosin regulatory light chain 2, skeletal muscle isoform-like [Pseudopodoces humilis]|uniref:myosin regulatory light chain 2, skeletal muscle isoform-like n=1 Tax=Pseudopodoces humilis TaxID=181119 RepID=UPI0006B80F79|nr:PREDICTED: myosin regulatory light chain 2, skeletal muscle isoform-like [Pseudopodoces humilis]
MEFGGVWAFTVIDQNRDGIIDKDDLRETFAAMGLKSVNRKGRGFAMQMSAKGFKGGVARMNLEELLTTQCDRFTPEEIKNMWAAFPPDVAGNVDYKNICYVITHGEDKEGE